MAKINNKDKYPFDINLSLDDFVIGSDANNVDFTRNYKLSGIYSTFKTALNLASIEYTFSDGVTDPSLDENDGGYFTTNSTSAAAVVEININKLDSSGIDITSLLEVVDDQPSVFVLRLFKASVTGQVFYFAISAITDNLDDTYTLSLSNFVGGNTLQDGTTYSFVFDLAGVPSIYTETDPVFLASPAGSILNSDKTNWNTAFGWGNHAVAGYLTSVAIGDVTGFTDNSTNWNTAFSWGDHALAGYVTSFSETDPIFTASPAGSIIQPNIDSWNLAFSWGNHALAGYITGESDPIFTGSVAFGITNIDINSWDSAYQWGDHAAVGYLDTDQTAPQTIINGAPNFSAGLEADFVDISVASPAPPFKEGRIFYDNVNKCITAYDDIVGTSLQNGQEIRIRVFNNTGSIIVNGSAVTVVGITLDGVVQIELAIASDKTSSLNTIGIATHDIGIGEYGWATTTGSLSDIDTSAYTEGSVIYLSETVAGAYQLTRPLSPSYEVRMGGVLKQNATTGKLFAETRVMTNDHDNNKFYNGTILEDHTVTITTTPTVTTLNVIESGSRGYLSLIINQEYIKVFNPINIILTNGTDTVPIRNFIYFNNVGVITVSTSGFPNAQQHAPIAVAMVQSAASVNAYGVYKLHAWTDELSGSTGQGHLSHINKWIRNRPATWESGVVLTTTIGSALPTIPIAYSSGSIYQLHPHVFPAFDTATGSGLYEINNPTTPYIRRTSISPAIDTDSLGNAIGNNKYYKLVIWGVSSELESQSKLMINLPSGSYTNVTDALNDIDKTANFTIPIEYLGTGFLITSMIIQRGTTNVEIITGSVEDLRGLFPTTGAGGGTTGGAGVTAWTELNDTPVSITANGVVVANGAGTALEFVSLGTDLQSAFDAKVDLAGDTMTGALNVPDQAYGASWNGSTQVPTKNAIYDKIETLGSGAVSSVFGRTGAVVAQVGDYSSFYLGIGATAVNSNQLGGKVLTASGNRFDVVPFVATDGVMEVGKFIDFHGTDGDTTDFLTRLEADAANSLRLVGNFTATGKGTFGGGESLKLIGLGAGVANINYIQFYESDGTTSVGYVGVGSGSSADFTMYNQASNQLLILDEAGGNNGLQFYDGASTRTVWHAGNDGAGSGLDADLLDGVSWGNVNTNILTSGERLTIRSTIIRDTNAAQTVISQNSGAGGTIFIRPQGDGIGTGETTFSGSTLNTQLNISSTGTGTFGGKVKTVSPNNEWAFQADTNGVNFSGLYFDSTPDSTFILRDAAGTIKTRLSSNGSNATNIINGNTIWHAGNDGAGSGLDADILDGIAGDQYIRQNTRFVQSYTWLKNVANNNSTLYLQKDGGTGSILECRSGTGDGTIVASIGSAGEINSKSTIVSQGNEIRVEGLSPRLRFIETDATANQWTFIADGNNFTLRENNTTNVRMTFLDGGAASFSSTVTATNFILSSDARLKERIKPLNDVEGSLFYSYYRKDEPTKLRFGTIAQEVEKVYPDLVTENEEGEKSVMMTDLLSKKVADQEQQIKDQEERIQLLEAKLELILKSL
jgi:hypothetical protein